MLRVPAPNAREVKCACACGPGGRGQPGLPAPTRGQRLLALGAQASHERLLTAFRPPLAALRPLRPLRHPPKKLACLLLQGPGGAAPVCVRAQAPAAPAGAPGQGPSKGGTCSLLLGASPVGGLLPCCAAPTAAGLRLPRSPPVLCRSGASARPCAPAPACPAARQPAPPPRWPTWPHHPPAPAQGQRASISLKALAEAFPSRPAGMIKEYLRNECGFAVRVRPFVLWSPR